MLRFLASSTLYLLGNAIGLIIASFLLEDFQIEPVGFVVSLLFFTLVGILLGPFVLTMSIRYMPALRGGIALVTTFIGLFLTSIFTDGLSITSLQAWILAPLIVWLCVVLAGIILPLLLFKKALSNRSTQE